MKQIILVIIFSLLSLGYVCSLFLSKQTGLEMVLSKPPNILVLGGTGFVGGTVIATALKKIPDCKIVSISRRGSLSNASNRVKWIKGDASCPDVFNEVAEFGPFDAVVHAVGLLLDVDSGLSVYNRLASGSSSEPGAR